MTADKETSFRILIPDLRNSYIQENDDESVSVLSGPPLSVAKNESVAVLQPQQQQQQ